MTDKIAQCWRCRALVYETDLEIHAEWCDRVNDLLPFRACGEPPPTSPIGLTLQSCHRRARHSGGHYYDVHPGVQPTAARWWRR
jgi:hypothetical protein